MIRSLHIDGYRGFTHLDVWGLGRVNLLVGKNNGGKTSVLEALYLLGLRGDPYAMWHLLRRRGELFPSERDPKFGGPELDLCHLFTGHELHEGSKIAIEARNGSPERRVSFEVVESQSGEQTETLFGDEGLPIQPRLALRFEGMPQPITQLVPITRRGGLRLEQLDGPRRSRRKPDEDRALYVSTESLIGTDPMTLWDRVALTPDENLVLRSLQFVDSDIERIAAQSSAYSSATGMRSGFIVKKRGSDHPIPIGSLGDGVWHMLVMALALTQCKDGMLLVDEIDSGLHYSIMSAMWRMILRAASEFDVQVFATTHSSDCVGSLADICAHDDRADSDVSLQRVEAGKSKTTPYSEREIRVAAEREIEVR